MVCFTVIINTSIFSLSFFSLNGSLTIFYLIGKLEREYEMILKRTLQSICILTVNPNTTTSVIVQVRLMYLFRDANVCSLGLK